MEAVGDLVICLCKEWIYLVGVFFLQVLTGLDKVLDVSYILVYS